MHGGSFERSGIGTAVGVVESGDGHQQCRGDRVERESTTGRLGVRRGTGGAGYGLLGARTVNPPQKPTMFPKPGTVTPGTASPAKPAMGSAAAHVKRGPIVSRPQTSEERRRAQRVLLKMPVIIHIPGKNLPLHGITHTVSASGAT